MATKRKKKQKSKTLKRKQIPKNAYKKYKKYKKIYHGGVGEDDCAICLEQIQDADLVKTDCKHRFHKKCIVKWFAKKNITCPICREELNVLVKRLMQDILDASPDFEAIKEERKTLDTEIDTYIKSILDLTVLQEKETEQFKMLTIDFKNKLATLLFAVELEQLYNEIKNQQGIPYKIINRHSILQANTNLDILSFSRSWYELKSFLRSHGIDLYPVISGMGEFKSVPEILKRLMSRAT